MRKIVRGVVAATAATALLVTAGCSGDESATPEKAGGQTSVQKVSYLTGLGLLGRESFVYVAEKKGFFAEVGLEVEVRPGAGTASNLGLLEAGKVDFAAVDVAAGLIEYGKGTHKNFKIISAIHQRALACIIALEGSGITSPRDLSGKSVGFIPGGTNYTLFPLYAQLAGLDPKSVEFVQAKAENVQQFLAAGQVDAITQLVVGKPTVEAAAKGRPTVVLPYSDYITDLYGNGVGVSTKTLTERRDLVSKFNGALLRGLQYSIDHPDEAGQIFKEFNKQGNEKAAAAEMDLMKPYVLGGTKVGAMDPQRVARSIAVLQGAGLMPDGVTPDGVVDFGLIS
ncbi:MAG TPA: ABC transporter substrate-binding protein [Asanoa sp.]|nr:ABC transporter substrate-binding protein [Asanoa sp.]